MFSMYFRVDPTFLKNYIQKKNQVHLVLQNLKHEKGTIVEPQSLCLCFCSLRIWNKYNLEKTPRHDPLSWGKKGYLKCLDVCPLRASVEMTGRLKLCQYTFSSGRHSIFITPKDVLKAQSETGDIYDGVEFSLFRRHDWQTCWTEQELAAKSQQEKNIFKEQLTLTVKGIETL